MVAEDCHWKIFQRLNFLTFKILFLFGFLHFYFVSTNILAVFFQFVFSVALVSRCFQLVCRIGNPKDPKTFDLFTEESSL